MGKLKTVAISALVAVVAITTMALSADDALARGGRGGYGRSGGCAWYSAPGTGPYCPTGTGPLRLQLSMAARGMQGPPGAMRRGERALRAVENLRMRRLMQELRPNQEQRMLIREAYEQGLERRHELLQERAALLVRMRGMVRPGGPTGGASDIKASEQEMRELVLKYRRVERELAQAAWDTEDRIFERLSPAQKLRYIVLNERFDTELRERIGALKQRGLGPGAPVPPDDLPDDLSE